MKCKGKNTTVAILVDMMVFVEYHKGPTEKASRTNKQVEQGCRIQHIQWRNNSFVSNGIEIMGSHVGGNELQLMIQDLQKM